MKIKHGNKNNLENGKINDGLVKRILIYIIGVFILSFAVGVSIKSNLGVTPINSIPYVFALITPY